MKNIDVELIHRVLDGDDNAFETLVKKYRKPVHALVWRKIGDFHIAEEITQDTFLKAYQELAKLKKPQSFASWLYVIAANQCSSWLRKKRLRTQPIEETSSAQLEKATYSGYIIEENERTAVEAQREVVKNLLAKLQESDRTVITLHYFGDMSAAEIGSFLGVSVNTIKSRLRRAQQRLKREEPMVRAALEHFQITPNLTENIMREVSRMRPVTPPSGSKPLIPVTLSAATAVLIFLIMGMGSQYLARFQKPYNIDAQSEMTVEIIDASVVLDTQAKPDLRNQAGRFDTIGKRSSTGSQLSEPVTLGAAQLEKEVLPSTQQQWIQANGPAEGATTSGLMASSKGDIYAASPVGIYRLAPDAPTWTLVNTSVTLGNTTPMAERDDTLYLVATREVLTSVDSGETWKSLGERPKGNPIGLVITDEGLYLALDNQVFRSEDAGQQWTPLIDKNAAGIVLAIAAIENSVFVGTNQGLYRVHSGAWEKLTIETSRAIHSLTVSENNLYVGTGLDFAELETADGRVAYAGQLAAQLMGGEGSSTWEIFHSTDLGDSWTEITPTSLTPIEKVSPSVKIFATGETLLAMGMLTTLRSIDGGKTWMSSSFNRDTFDVKSMMDSIMPAGLFPAIAVDENTLLKSGFFGVTRSTDGGKSWHPFMKGIVGTSVSNLVAFKNALYANTIMSIAKSTDGGQSWEALRLNSGESTPKSVEKVMPNDFLVGSQLTISDDIFYGIALRTEDELIIFRLSTDGSVLIPIPWVPLFSGGPSIEKPKAASHKASKKDVVDNTPDSDEEADRVTEIAQRMDPAQQMQKYPRAFAVSGETFYVEYGGRLFRWKRGEREWFNTGLVDTAAMTLEDNAKALVLAVSGETVYVGKGDGHLFRSLDGGNTWKDLTSNLPLRFEHFNAIVFADSTVFVATDSGVLMMSADGEHWRGITDKTGVHTVIDRMTIAGTTVYGVGKSGAHLLDKHGKWEKISPEIPDSIISAVINADRLYVATEKRGMFHISLENENN